MGFILATLALIAIIVVALRIKEPEGGWDNGAVPVFRTGALIVAPLLLALLIFNGFTRTVPPGQAQVGILFGKTQDGVYRSGFHITNPLLDFEAYSTKRIAIDFQGAPPAEGEAQTADADQLLAQSSDQVPITLDATFAALINPKWMPWLLANIGNQDAVENTLLRPAGRAAVRTATARYTMSEAITSKRLELAASMAADAQAAAVLTLKKMGLSEAEAGEVITFLPVLLRKVDPPARVQVAQAENVAAQRDLERAGTLVQIEQKNVEAQRARGAALTALKDAAPAGWSAADIERLQRGQADLKRAEAIAAAVESGKVTLVLTDGGSGNVTVGTSR